MIFLNTILIHRIYHSFYISCILPLRCKSFLKINDYQKFSKIRELIIVPQIKITIINGNFKVFLTNNNKFKVFWKRSFVEHSGYLPSKFQHLSELPVWRRGVGAWIWMAISKGRFQIIFKNILNCFYASLLLFSKFEKLLSTYLYI